jgi:fatty-acyl-CoA synthase
MVVAVTRETGVTGPAVAGAEAYRRQDPGPVPARELFFHDLLVSAARSAGDREAIVFAPGDPERELRLTYAQLDAAVTDTARALVAAGVTRGGAVAVYGGNRPEYVLLQFACSRIGAAAVPVNPLYELDELVYVLDRAGAQIGFVAPGRRDQDLWRRLGTAAGELPRLRLRVSLEERADGTVGWERWLAAGRAVDDRTLAGAEAATTPHDTVQIQFTSGTTGRPKAVELSGFGMANGGRCVAHRAGLTDGCRYLHAMPFFHVGGTVTAMAAAMAVAGTHVFLPSFNPRTMSAAIEHEQPDAILAVPTMMISLADYAESHGLALTSLETVLTGGALVPEAVAARWVDGYGVGISNTYGMTEISGPAIQTSPTDPRDRALNTCGRPLPGVEVEVVVPGTTDRIAIDEEGEIRFRGWGLMNGYLGDADATAAAIDHDRWLRSGDLGRLGADGFVQVTGRAKDVIIRGGENIAPSAVEDAIRAHVPSVVDVSVVGVPDDYYGESIAAYVTLRPGTTLTQGELAQRLDGRLATFRIPAHLRVLEALPTTGSGKVQKFRLVEMFEAEPR